MRTNQNSVERVSQSDMRCQRNTESPAGCCHSYRLGQSARHGSRGELRVELEGMGAPRSRRWVVRTPTKVCVNRFLRSWYLV